MSYQFIVADTLIAEITFLLDVIINSPAQIFPIKIAHGVTLQYPLSFGDIVFTQFACMLQYAFKDSAMQRYVAICRKVACLYRKYAFDVLRSFVSLLHIIIVSLTGCFTFIVTVEQQIHLIYGDFTRDISLCQVNQIL